MRRDAILESPQPSPRDCFNLFLGTQDSPAKGTAFRSYI